MLETHRTCTVLYSCQDFIVLGTEEGNVETINLNRPMMVKSDVVWFPGYTEMAASWRSDGKMSFGKPETEEIHLMKYGVVNDTTQVKVKFAYSKSQGWIVRV